MITKRMRPCSEQMTGCGANKTPALSNQCISTDIVVLSDNEEEVSDQGKDGKLELLLEKPDSQERMRSRRKFIGDKCQT